MAEKLRTLSLTPKRNFLIKDNECTLIFQEIGSDGHKDPDVIVARRCLSTK